MADRNQIEDLAIQNPSVRQTYRALEKVANSCDERAIDRASTAYNHAVENAVREAGERLHENLSRRDVASMSSQIVSMSTEDMGGSGVCPAPNSRPRQRY